MSNFGPRATLGDVANGEEIVASGVFDDEAVCTALLALLPEGQRTREEQRLQHRLGSIEDSVFFF